MGLGSPEQERQLDATAGAHGAAEYAPAVDEGAQADLAHVQAPYPGQERQLDATAGAHGAAEDAPAVDVGAQADLAHVQAP
nr:hypothetical protein [Tanacetum cinerariifolium]